MRWSDRHESIIQLSPFTRYQSQISKRIENRSLIFQIYNFFSILEKENHDFHHLKIMMKKL